MRLFFAIDIPRDDALSTLYGKLGELSRGLKPADPAKQHITLKYIGDPPCPFDKVVQAAETLHGGFGGLKLEPLGFGAFPDWRRPSVLWIGLDCPEALAAIATSLDHSLNDMCGIPLERRPFKAHITTARVRDPSGLDIPKVRELHSQALAKLIDRRYTVDVREFVLYGSTLTPNGPIYERLRGFPLVKDSDGQ